MADGDGGQVLYRPKRDDIRKLSAEYEVRNGVADRLAMVLLHVANNTNDDWAHDYILQRLKDIHGPT